MNEDGRRPDLFGAMKPLRICEEELQFIREFIQVPILLYKMVRDKRTAWSNNYSCRQKFVVEFFRTRDLPTTQSVLHTYVSSTDNP